MTIPLARTVGVIARSIEQPIHRVEYVIRACRIQPISRAGNARVFAEEDVQRIAGELQRIDANRGQRQEHGA